MMRRCAVIAALIIAGCTEYGPQGEPGTPGGPPGPAGPQGPAGPGAGADFAGTVVLPYGVSSRLFGLSLPTSMQAGGVVAHVNVVSSNGVDVESSQCTVSVAIVNRVGDVWVEPSPATCARAQSAGGGLNITFDTTYEGTTGIVLIKATSGLNPHPTITARYSVGNLASDAGLVPFAY